MRWKFFIPTLVVVAIVAVFNILFLDVMLKAALVSTGEMVFGAKVEVKGFKTRFKDMSVGISGLQIASRKDPFKNLLDVDSIKFSAEPLPLLSKKVIIDQMSCDGIKWGTKRLTSGALPPKKEKKYAKKAAKEKKNGMLAKLFSTIEAKSMKEINALPAMGEMRGIREQLKTMDLKKAVDIADLQSVQEIEKMKGEYAAKYDKYREQVAAIDYSEKMKLAQNALADASNIKVTSIQDAQNLKGNLEGLNKTKDELDKSVAELRSLQKQVLDDYGSEKDILNRLNDLKDADYKAVADKLKIPTVSFESVSRSLFGPVWVGRVNTAVHYIGLVRKYMPAKKNTQKELVKQRIKGRDVVFPKEQNPPDLHIKKISISGTTGGAGKAGTPLDFTGTIIDITSTPSLIGKPTRAEITGRQGAKMLKIQAVLDHTREIPVDTFNINYEGLSAEEFGMPDSEYLPSFEKGRGSITGNLTLMDDNIDSILELSIRNLSVRQGGNGDDEMQKIVAELWSGIDRISVNAKLTGTTDDLEMSFYSNIDRVLSARLSKIYGKKLAEIQDKIKSEINRLTNARKNELTGEVNAKRDELKNQFEGKSKELASKADELEKMKQAKENEGKALVDAEKKKAEEEARKAREAVEAEKRKAQEAAEAEKRKAEEEKRKAQEAAEAEKRKAQAEADAQKKKQEEELKNKASDKLKGLFGK
ncbi:MAG: TIGR03545 family protein [Endomicrobiales bacterium]|nr:TIGR03545 family protein [Endomicrobiales bacterium]